MDGTEDGKGVNVAETGEGGAEEALAPGGGRGVGAADLLAAADDRWWSDPERRGRAIDALVADRTRALEEEMAGYEVKVKKLSVRIQDLEARNAELVGERQKLAEELKATAEANAVNRQNLRNTAASIVDLAAQIGRAIA